jgi:hypothetical protein
LKAAPISFSAACMVLVQRVEKFGIQSTSPPLSLSLSLSHFLSLSLSLSVSVGLGFEIRSLNSGSRACKAGDPYLSHTSSPFFSDYFGRWGSCELFVWSWPKIRILQISVSQVARILGMNHWHQAHPSLLTQSLVKISPQIWHKAFWVYWTITSLIKHLHSQIFWWKVKRKYIRQFKSASYSTPCTKTSPCKSLIITHKHRSALLSLISNNWCKRVLLVLHVSTKVYYLISLLFLCFSKHSCHCKHFLFFSSHIGT